MLREVRGSGEGSFAIELCSRTLGFSGVDCVSQCLFGVKVKGVSVRSRRGVLGNLVKRILQAHPG